MASIDKLLIANRGEIARRIARTCREMGIDTVAVCSDPDLDAPIVAEVDEVVRLPGHTAADTYLSMDRVIDAALRTGADAIHPGYGFLSENAAFARACGAAGIVFVGPPPGAIERMGSKLASKEVMNQVGVPVLEGTDVTNLDAGRLRDTCERIGLPLLVKASAGGGGRGIRIVRELDELEAAVLTASREAKSAFGDETVLLEPFVDCARHVEVQVLADVHGTVTHLFERDCSVQRRYQKVVEEAPSPAVDSATRDALGAAAIAAARAVGYVGAGTVEFLLAPDGAFFFLEMNTRLQVEHPITEAITGIDIVRVQLLVAAGEPLPEEVVEARWTGHAVEARVYAEDPGRDFAPATGTVEEFAFDSDGGVRVDSAVEAGVKVSPHYDAMLAKVIAWAPTRREAVRVLRRALRAARIRGITTNRELLVAVLEDARFLAGDVDTGFLDDFSPAWYETSRSAIVAAAATVGSAFVRRRQARVLAEVTPGWRNTGERTATTTIEVGGEAVAVEYTLSRDGTGRVRAGAFEFGARCAGEGLVELDDAGVIRRFSIHADGAEITVSGGGRSVVVQQLARFGTGIDDRPRGSLSAPMPGTVVRVLVAAGVDVHPGAALVVIEAMKMEHTITAPEAGTVAAVHVEIGSQVEAGDVLAVIEAIDLA